MVGEEFEIMEISYLGDPHYSLFIFINLFGIVISFEFKDTLNISNKWESNGSAFKCVFVNLKVIIKKSYIYLRNGCSLPNT